MDQTLQEKGQNKIQLKLEKDEENSIILQNYSRSEMDVEKNEKKYNYREVVRDKDKR